MSLAVCNLDVTAARKRARAWLRGDYFHVPHLRRMAEDVLALADALERRTRERDEAQRMIGMPAYAGTFRDAVERLVDAEKHVRELDEALADCNRRNRPEGPC